MIRDETLPSWKCEQIKIDEFNSKAHRFIYICPCVSQRINEIDIDAIRPSRFQNSDNKDVDVNT